MARANLTVTPVPRAGLSLAGALTPAVADGHSYGYSAKRQIRLKNVATAARTVTIVMPGEVDGQPLPDRPYTIPANTGDVLIPPVPEVYRQSDGTVWINYDDPAGVSVTVYELP
ncbi:hypothetical protein [Nonomuraea lactucae]|uniref:hypothetical protein n=1 Tax=Nonomuraea lactucae TaxID=2249762 RepID=UPI000DE25ABA|nr:hypothetical protein [Nonomuraea lactucae]